MRLAAWKGALSIGLAAVLAVISAPTARTTSGGQPTVFITAVSGYAGHAFIYAQVNDSGASYPAPTGNHDSPYYAEWIRQPIGGSACPWVWAVYVFDRLTHVQVNLPAPNGSRNFGTTTVVCASPSTTPVEQPPVSEASARLDLDLAVSVTPPVSNAGSPSILSAVLSSRLTQDLDLYLNMAIQDWMVTTWSIDFDDGQRLTLSSSTGTSVRVPHTYRSAGAYDARVVATIGGHAQAAAYDRYGNAYLIRQPFSLEIGNHALATARSQPIRRYLPPQGVVTVTPSVGPSAPDGSASGFRQVDALRGVLTNLRVHLLLTREGVTIENGRAIVNGRSALTGWRLDSAISDAPRGSGTSPAQVHAAADVLRLQWNTPNRIVRSQPEDYAVSMTLFVETRFPDGHIGSYAIPSTFHVSVNFAAESG